MKRAMFSILTLVVLATLAGCMAQHGRRPWACLRGSCAQAPENCQACDDCNECRGPGFFHPGGCLRKDRCPCEGEAVQNAGPPTGTVTYPYYTTRGPRDFLANNPPSIGP